MTQTETTRRPCTDLVNRARTERVAHVVLGVLQESAAFENVCRDLGIAS